jgi:hypothetical protein
MFEFLVESYAERETTNLLRGRVQADALAAAQVREAGAEVRLLRVIFLPADEVCFYLYEAASADAVREAVTRAGLDFERITEVVSL